MNAKTSLINIKELSFRYPGGPPVIDQLNFTLCLGDRIGLIASNGSGKTTLVHLIMGLLKPFSGHMEILGKSVKEETDFVGIR